MNTTQFLFKAWNWNLWAVVSCIAALVAYLALFRSRRRIGWFLGGLAVLLLTLMSPINALADGYLFSAHMLQHILLLLIVPAMILLSLPPTVSLAVRPRVLGHPFIGWAAGVSAMWFWHVPAICNAAVSSRPVHALQTISLLILGTAFWRQVIAPRDSERLPPPSAVAYLFAACATCGVLGIIITLSPVTVCSAYTMPSMDRLGMLATIRDDWGLTAQRDQQVGGLLMWVPMCLVYLSAIFAQMARWFAGPETTESKAC
ncbi:MAG TPA: cytochrome c oxidase assembly protein [Candidatus Polarisedimenticolia bacterium]|nr:cytochrome c oxidase assembly protein [Candidatus Polarisedimenticolia bacterium]